MPSIQRPRGTRDFGPEEMGRRRYIEGIMRKTAETFGYREIMTPTFEHSELYTERSGEAIRNEMYTFKDKSDRELALRPELTMPAIRFYANELTHMSKPIKIYYSTNCFRYERPQSGRFREFWQFGAETIGGGEYEADAEIIALAVECIRNSGLKDFKTRIGHLGVLRALLKDMGVDKGNQSKCMQLIDKGELNELYNILESIAQSEEKIDKIKAILDLEKPNTIPSKTRDIITGCEEAIKAIETLEKILTHLKGLGVGKYTIDLGIARGLDYYTGMVFEIDVPFLGAEKQVCGGGAYELATLFDAKPTNSTGFAIGFDRVMMALEKKKAKIPVPILIAYVIPMNEEAKEEALRITTDLRRNGISCDVVLMDRSISKHMKHANSLKAKYAIIIGEDEIKTKEVSIKNMESGEQVKVSFKEIVNYFKNTPKHGIPRE